MADPMDYTDTLTLWLGEQEGCLPILMTGVGTRFIYRRRSETTDDMCLLDILLRGLSLKEMELVLSAQ